MSEQALDYVMLMTPGETEEDMCQDADPEGIQIFRREFYVKDLPFSQLSDHMGLEVQLRLE